MTERVTGIGSVFFKAREPQACSTGTPGTSAPGGRGFHRGHVTTKYFDPSPASFMINYRVADLDAMLRQLRAAGVAVDDRIEDSEFGRFGWATDPEGNRFELWQPPDKLP